MAGPKITMVGAGGMSFGPSMVNDVCHTPSLADSRLVLHDVNAERLERAYRFAVKLNDATGSRVRVERTTEPAEAYEGADFVMASAEFGRFRHWREDYEVPKKYGARHINGENGGPGAVFHSLRSIGNTLRICADIERHSPDAFLINLTNPMSRVTLAINRATKVRNVGMCHEMPGGVRRLAAKLKMDHRDVAAKASGINHFTFYTEFRDRRTGEDLLPKFGAGLYLYHMPLGGDLRTSLLRGVCESRCTVSSREQAAWGPPGGVSSANWIDSFSPPDSPRHSC